MNLNTQNQSMLPRSCKLCNSVDIHVLADSVYGDESNKKAFYRCSNCDVVFQHPFFTKSEEKAFYQKSFEAYMSERSGSSSWLGANEHIEANKKTFERRFEYLDKWVDCWSELDVLEIGCSSGFMLFPVAELGARISGIEPSTVFSSFLKDNKVNLYNNLQEIPDKSMDIIFHFFVMEHITDIKDWFRQQYRILKPGGTIIVEVPSYDDPLYTIFNNEAFHKFYWSVVHPWYFNKNSIIFLMNELDFINYELIPYQRYGLKNHFNWAIKNSPGMDDSLFHITSEVDDSYKKALETSGKTDTLLIKYTKD